MSIRSGDLVRLKSGGPQMTAGEKRGDDLVECHWFDGQGRSCIQTFPANALVEVPGTATKEKAG